ncbi:hypothetical protein E5163_08765 [Marinicauda algicola]|uniref:Uncharacterized protein n=1 Tax=Marinicauda algicola TaxID=2029849 RepID=A0A4S2H0Z6_9PROT|nr:hypothetical protein [Marinicauda algicola]TGY89200.1 hypothetical protein E5163_08765 [Marinicauda algicola]
MSPTLWSALSLALAGQPTGDEGPQLPERLRCEILNGYASPAVISFADDLVGWHLFILTEERSIFLTEQESAPVEGDVWVSDFLYSPPNPGSSRHYFYELQTGWPQQFRPFVFEMVLDPTPNPMTFSAYSSGIGGMITGTCQSG